MAGSDAVINNTQAWMNRTAAAVHGLGQHYAGKMEAYATTNASWEDQTGAARTGLFGDVAIEGDFLRVFVAHAVDYGPYLELAMHGAYSTLKPTVQQYRDPFYRDVRRLVR